MSEPVVVASGPPAEPATWWRRIASIIYESLLILAIVFIATVLFPGAATGRLGGVARYVLFAYLLGIVGLYLTWSWTRGQTLAMKAWRLAIVDARGQPIDWARAVRRYLGALALVAPMLASGVWLREHRDSVVGWLLLAPGLLTLVWPLWDRERRALYDLIAGTRLVRLL